jgi:hypothetical protein
MTGPESSLETIRTMRLRNICLRIGDLRVIVRENLPDTMIGRRMKPVRTPENSC